MSRMHEVGKGALARFIAPFSGDRIEIERRKAEATRGHLAYGKRFCETCQSYRPKGKRPAFKGWKCDGCRGKA